MRFYLVETRATPAGHEIDYDRQIIEELRARGHEVSLVLPQGVEPKMSYDCPVRRLASPVGPDCFKPLKSFLGELARRRIFNELTRLAEEDACEALIFPTATYRYLRAAWLSDLKRCPKTVFFILHGLSPHERPKVLKYLDKISANRRLKAVIHTLAPPAWQDIRPTLIPLVPPLYQPVDRGGPLAWQREPGPVVNLGFFGQYRREKNLRALVQAFKAARFTSPVRLVVQGAFPNRAARLDFEAVMAEDAAAPDSRITFIPRPLIGLEWQRALEEIEVMLITYNTKRYLWHWSGVLFSALGYGLPVVAPKFINPEVFQQFKVGMTFDPDLPGDLTRVLEEVVNNYHSHRSAYTEGLKAAASAYAPQRLAEALEALTAGHFIPPADHRSL